MPIKYVHTSIVAKVPANYKAFPSAPVEEIVAKGAEAIDVLKQATLALMG
jgi:hypothetical protein